MDTPLRQLSIVSFISILDDDDDEEKYEFLRMPFDLKYSWIIIIIIEWFIIEIC